MADTSGLCAATARERGDAMVGTALHVRRFLLVEHPGPWPFHALEALPAPVREALVEATTAAGGRTILVRRPGRQEPAEERAWAVADVAAGRITWGSWREPDDLLAARGPLASASEGWSEDPVLLVCAHGRHDTCCAVRGRPVAAALAAEHGDLVWECSHVGGDRFAANLVVLPDGTYYGAVDDEPGALDVAARHLAGDVVPSFLRGSSLLPPVAQAVAAAAHRRWGPAGPRDARSATVERLAPDRWRVELRCTGRLPEVVAAEVVAGVGPAAVLTCAAPRPTSARTWDVQGLADVSPAGAAPRG